MATNPYVNKVIYGNDTVMDISDTTATESDVASGKTFYKASGAKGTGSASLDSAVWGNITGTLADQTDLKSALDDKMSYADNGILGAKNLLKFPYVTSTTTKNGITFTVNSDGSVTLGSDQGSQTATGVANIELQNNTKFRDEMIALKGKTLILSGGANVSNSIYVQLYKGTGNPSDKGGGVEFTVPDISEFANNWNFNITVLQDTVISEPIIIYPMLRLATDTDSTYQPYAMTNKELTDSGYTTSDSAETTIDDADYFPFYDTSASAKKKSLWSNIKAKLKTYFDGYYFSKDDNLYNSINDDNYVPFASDTSPYTRLITFSTFKNAILSLAKDLIKSTVGWLGNNLADTSKAEIGISGSGSANTKRARLIVPVESEKTYYITLSGTNNFTAIAYCVCATIPPDYAIWESVVFPMQKTIPSGGKYLVFEFTKATDVTASDISALKFMVSESYGDSYNDYHKSVEESLDEWTAEQTISTSDTSKTFTGLNANYAYKPFIQVADGEDELQYNSIVFSGTSCTISFDSPTSAQCAGNACKIKLRVIK